MSRDPVPRRSAPGADVRTFEQLVSAVTATLVRRKERAEWEAVLCNWETGRFINEHVLLNEKRANYSAEVYPKLARRTNISQRLLYQCAQFARLFPNLHGRAKLSWSHYRVLCQLDDAGQRAALCAETNRRGWSPDELEARVRQLNALRFDLEGAEETNHGDAGGTSNGSPAPRPRLLVPKFGRPGVYPVVARAHDRLAADLGFKTFLPLAATTVRALHVSAGSFVRAAADGGGLECDAGATKADLFTYRGADVRVVDGDTLALTIALPPHNEIDKKLRLRGIDCPELDTAAGKAAKQFAQRLVAAATDVLLTSTKPDKYDRYLADVFLELPPDASEDLDAACFAATAGGRVFLNNALLAHGHADRSDGSVHENWIP